MLVTSVDPRWFGEKLLELSLTGKCLPHQVRLGELPHPENTLGSDVQVPDCLFRASVRVSNVETNLGVSRRHDEAHPQPLLAPGELGPLLHDGVPQLLECERQVHASEHHHHHTPCCIQVVRTVDTPAGWRSHVHSHPQRDVLVVFQHGLQKRGLLSQQRRLRRDFRPHACRQVAVRMVPNGDSPKPASQRGDVRDVNDLVRVVVVVLG
mmetsp:Transcript_29211/g.72932  ORF Transcript_29211/g.72932 Transcript_29211/m.72932 type:complete len:209 (-) Transcript_29211:2860-3486(-)